MRKIKLSDIKTKSIPILKRHGIKKAAIFDLMSEGRKQKKVT